MVMVNEDDVDDLLYFYSCISFMYIVSDDVIFILLSNQNLLL